MKGLAETIDKLISMEFRRDGVLDGVIEPLYREARRQHSEPLAWSAAEKLLEVASPQKKIFIATGHIHPVALPNGETDGPPGAAALARSLVLATTSPVILLCEQAIKDVLIKTCTAAGLVVRDDESLLPMPRSIVVRAFPIDIDEARKQASQMAVDAAAIITIEKIGRANDGGYYTGQGTDVADHLAKVDLLVDEIRDNGGLTIGIGDLGNEMGFGNIYDTVVTETPKGNIIGCIVPTDILVVAGCSNWGAYGISAAIAAIRRDISILHTGDIEKEMIRECCLAGGVDGFSTGPTMEVDGASINTHADFVQLLRDIVEISMSKRKPERYRFEEVQ